MFMSDTSLSVMWHWINKFIQARKKPVLMYLLVSNLERISLRILFETSKVVKVLYLI